jgi:large repetitive protein
MRHPGLSMPILALLVASCALPTAERVSPSAAHGPSVALEESIALPGADSSRVRTLGDGVVHAFFWDPRGPWAVHLIAVDPAACGIEIRAVKAEDRLLGRATTTRMAADAGIRSGSGVLAAVNADFFSFDPPGVPVGANVVDGEIVSPPARRPVFGIDEHGRPFIATVSLSGEVWTRRGDRAPVASVNRPYDGDGLVLLNRFAPAFGDSAAAPRTVRLAGSRTFALGDTARYVVVPDDEPAMLALSATGPYSDTFLREAVQEGDTVTIWIDLDAPASRARQVVGGFPALLRAGDPTHHLDGEVTPAFGERRHPRTAVGWRPDGTILLVTVDGRQPHYSAGMSLEELASLMAALGASDALNLDGGGSTTMVVGGWVVNRPSDPTGERANANALVVAGPGPDDACPTTLDRIHRSGPASPPISD